MFQEDGCVKQACGLWDATREKCSFNTDQSKPETK